MPKAQETKAQETKADETLRRRLVEFVEKNGEKAALGLLEMSRQTLSRVMAGQSVRHATLVLVRIQLDKLAPVDSSDASKGGNHDAQ